MKALKIGITLFSLLAIVAVSSAQTARITKENARVERIITQLGLNEDQASKAREISAKYSELIKGTRDMDQKNAYKAEADSKVQEILTAEQYTEYKKIVAAEKKTTRTPKVKTAQ